MNQYISYTPEGKILLPNIKKIFIPDEGMELADIDLSGADIQVVASDSECKWLLDFFSKPQEKKVYAYIASEFFQRDISDKSSEYKLYKGIFHGVNYLMGVDKLAKTSGISYTLAKELRDFYFRLNPEIPRWHKRIEHDVRTKGYTQNKFGRRMWFTISSSNPTVMNEVAASIPQCVPIDHEVLTLDGWVRIENIKPTDSIAVWDTERNISFEVPKQWNYGEANRLIYLKELGYYCTENHTLPYYTASKNLGLYLKSCKAIDKPKQAQIPKNGIYNKGTLELSWAEIAYIVALQADGTVCREGRYISFKFTKKRKIERLERILNSLNLIYTETIDGRGCTNFYIPEVQSINTNLGNLIDIKYKYFGSYLLNFSGRSLDLFLEELQYWDGNLSKENQIWYCSNIKLNTDWVITIASLRGIKSYYISADARAKNTNYRVLINLSGKGQNAVTTSETVYKDSYVACPTVSTGFFLIKHNDIISITGNSTIADLINRGWIAIAKALPEVEVLMQVHDSLVVQYPISDALYYRSKILDLMKIPVPYKVPLYIGSDIKVSSLSYGDTRKPDYVN